MNMFSKNKPIRLEKKVSVKERITSWFKRNRYRFLLIGIILFFILFFTLLFFITPHVESGQYYYYKV